MLKYKTRWGGVEPVEVEGETEKFVIIQGRREAKRSEWSCYFDSFEEAKAHLVASAENAVTDAEQRLSAANKELALVLDLVEPEGAER